MGTAELPPIEIDQSTFLRDHCSLPALPELVIRVQELIQSEMVTTEKVEKLISMEPSLVAHLLRVVNSAYYALPRQVVRVKYAIDFIGLNEVYRIVLSMFVVNTLAVKEKDELNEFWYHSYYTALCTKRLAKKFDPRVPEDELWSGSILHDIGKLVYLKFFPDHYKAIKRYRIDQGCLYSQAEEHFPFPTSSYLGTLLCDHWKLPGKIRVACESHGLLDLQEVTGDSDSARFIRLICLGNLAAILAHEDLGAQTQVSVSEVVRESLGCSESQFRALMEELKALQSEVDIFRA